MDSHLRATVSYTDGFGAVTDVASATTTAVKQEPNYAPSIDNATTTFNFSVNVREGVRVARPFTATHLNGDTLTYSIAPDTPNDFTIDAETGEVLMGSVEPADGSTHTVTISVTDELDDDWNNDMSGIDDENGLINAQLAYKWIRNDGNSDADIQGAIGTSYTLTTADVGHTIKVKVSFTDDG